MKHKRADIARDNVEMFRKLGLEVTEDEASNLGKEVDHIVSSGKGTPTFDDVKVILEVIRHKDELADQQQDYSGIKTGPEIELYDDFCSRCAVRYKNMVISEFMCPKCLKLRFTSDHRPPLKRPKPPPSTRNVPWWYWKHKERKDKRE